MIAVRAATNIDNCWMRLLCSARVQCKFIGQALMKNSEDECFISDCIIDHKTQTEKLILRFKPT